MAFVLIQHLDPVHDSKLADLLAKATRMPVREVTPGLTVQPDHVELEALVAEVTASVQMKEREVRGPDGRWWLLRIHPYRTLDNRIDGAVLVLLDIDELRSAQAALQEARDYARAIVATVREPLLVLDAQLRVQSANQAFYAMFAVAQGDTVGRPPFELGKRQWDIPALRQQLADVLSRDSSFSEFEIRHDFEAIGPKVLRLNVRRTLRDGERTELILLAIEDHTELARLEQAAQQHVAQLVEDTAQEGVPRLAGP